MVEDLLEVLAADRAEGPREREGDAPRGREERLEAARVSGEAEAEAKAEGEGEGSA